MLSLERHSIPANFAIDGHGHAHTHLVIVAAGDFDEEVGPRVHGMKSGCARLSRAHASHRLSFGSAGADCMVAEARGEFWTRVFNRTLGRAENTFAAISPSDVQAFDASGSVEHLASSSERLLAFGRVLAAFRGPVQNEPPWFAEAIDLLDRGRLRSVAAVAKRLRRHRTHFARGFAAYAGFLPSEYRALRRAAVAAALVRAGQTRLCDVALDAGFTHQSHMTNTFRSLLGVQPSQLRGRGASYLQDGATRGEACTFGEEA